MACLGWSGAAAAERATGERETREFKVSVDGKERGKCTMQIGRRHDGADTVRIEALLRFNYVVYEYRYSSVGTEVWKDGRLAELENKADYNGTQYLVKASAHQKGVRVTVNGKTLEADPDAWATSYWRLPEHLAERHEPRSKIVAPEKSNGQARPAPALSVALIDSDKGQKLRGEMTRIGEETLTVAGKKKTCIHYRITGDVAVDVWYDSARRLVRQETVESGHKTLLHLARIAAE
ncbi:MAG TPA: DUF6134 family protein [Planctomycetaceae bacterium]|nr:DUF6134 family protein [Planctomycetaceae bacterium]